MPAVVGGAAAHHLHDLDGPAGALNGGDRTGGGPSQMLQIAHVLVLVAQHVGADEAVVKTLKRYRSRLSPPRRGLRPKPREALRQFVDRGNIEKLLMLPQRIHERLRRKNAQTIREESGLEVYPHLLRHVGATLYLTENPDGLDVVRRVLGHRSADTTYRAYAGVRDEVAVRRYDELVLGIRASILKELGDD